MTSPYPITLSRATLGVLALFACAPFYVWGWLLAQRTFPYGDGGLWYIVASSIIEANFALPPTVPFNGELLPLTYPPLAGYLLALIHHFTGVGLLRLIQWMPILLCILCVILFALFSKKYFGKPPEVAWAMLLFPSLLFSTGLFFTGGGVSRALGLLFMLASWWYLLRAAPQASPKHPFILGTLIAGAILSHPNAALWTVAGIIFIVIFEFPANRFRIGISFAIAGLLVAPWLGLAISHHGIQPFAQAFSVGSQEMWGWHALGSPDRFLIPGGFVGSLAVVGVCLMLGEKRLTFPLLALMGLMIDHRGLFALHGVVVSGIVLGIACPRLADLCDSPPSDSARSNSFGKALFVGLIAVTLGVALVQSVVQYNREPVQKSSEPIATYQQVAARTAPKQRVLYLRRSSPTDHGEWLASLTKLTVFPLPQGQEWTGQYALNINAFNVLAQCCESGSMACVHDYLSNTAALPFRGAIVIDRVSCQRLIEAIPGTRNGDAVGRFLVISPPHIFSSTVSQETKSTAYE